MVDLSLEQLSLAKKASFACRSQELEAGEGRPKQAAPTLSFLDRMVGKGLLPIWSHSPPIAGWHFKAETGRGRCSRWDYFISGLYCGNLFMEARIAATWAFHPGWAWGLWPGAPDGE